MPIMSRNQNGSYDLIPYPADQHYDATSTEAQSGKAVAEAIASIPSANNKVDRDGDTGLSGTFAPVSNNYASLGTSTSKFGSVHANYADFAYYIINDLPDVTYGAGGNFLIALDPSVESTFEVVVSDCFKFDIRTERAVMEIGSDERYGGVSLYDGQGGCVTLYTDDNGSGIGNNYVVYLPHVTYSGTHDVLALLSDIPSLSDSVSTTSSTTAATSTAVKTVNDSVANKVDKTGNNMLSGLFEPQTNNGAILGSSNCKFSALYTSKINGNTMPSGSGTIALTSDIPSVPSLPITVANGGTGATSASSARTNLGLGSAATYSATTSVTSGSSSLVTSGGVYSAIQPTDISSYITISSGISYSSLTKSAKYSAVTDTVSMQIEFTLSAAIAASTSPKTVAVLSSTSYRPPTIIVGIATDSGNKTAFPIIVTSAGSIQLYNNPAIGSGYILRLNATWCV